jgi:hypothetical protein
MRPAARPGHLTPLRRDGATGGTLTIAHADAAPARVPLWRLPRARALLLLAVLGIVGATLAGLARVYTDVLWFSELGHERVLWTTLTWKVLAHGLPGVGTAAFVLANLAVAERRLAPQAPYRRLVYPLVAVAAGLIAAARGGPGAWRLLALWSARVDFGTRDPLFHRDIGYFVFSLPLYQQVARWALGALVMAGVATVAVYATGGGLRRARAHLLALAAFGLVVLAARYRLEQFALAVPHAGSVVPGASYTDVHVRLPVLRALAPTCLAGAGL